MALITVSPAYRFSSVRWQISVTLTSETRYKPSILRSTLRWVRRPFPLISKHIFATSPLGRRKRKATPRMGWYVPRKLERCEALVSAACCRTKDFR